MGRVRTEDGKRVSIGLKVSEAKAEAVDAARGSTPRALWLEAAIDAFLALPVVVDPRPPEVAGEAIVPLEAEPARKRRAAPAAVEEVRALAESAGAPLVPASELEAPAPQPKGNCKHSRMRVRKGPCPDCDEWVTGKSLR